VKSRKKKPKEEREFIRTGRGVLFRSYMKHDPQITFILPKSFEIPPIVHLFDIFLEVEQPINGVEMFNLDLRGNPGESLVRYGSFFVSHKGVKCFRLKEDGEHALIRVQWGGILSEHFGYIDPVEELGVFPLYFKRTYSKSNRSGYNYWVLTKDFKYISLWKNEQNK
jgi:hypothetical protein